MPRLRPPTAPEPRVIACDDSVLVIDKPPGMLSAPGRGTLETVMSWLRRLDQYRDEPFRIVQRLDRDASGVIVYARTLEAQRALTEQFEQRQVEKTYGALVTGYVASDGVVDLPLSTDKRLNRTVVDTRRGKPSITRYRVLQRVTGNTWVECRPLTGRTHQIRVHMAAIGHPLTVDPDYGGGQQLLLSMLKSGYRPGRDENERPLIARLTLHAAEISFQHPTLGSRVTFTAPLPKDLRITLTQLGRRGERN